MPDTSVNKDDPQLEPLDVAELKTLAPEYIKANHELYVNHIMKGLAEPRNRNIALTGPYSSGKSSVLGEVVRRLEGKEQRGGKGHPKGEGQPTHKKPHAPSSEPRKVIKISIGTLGLDLGEQDITNRI